MPNFTWPGQPDAPLISDASLAALLAGAELPPGAAPELRALAEALAGLSGRPVGYELAGEADTLTAFRDHFGALAAADRDHNRRSRPRSRSVAAWAAAAAVTALGLGGLATAAYARALPAGLQRLAHDVIGAPAAGAQPGAPPSPAATAQPARTAPPPSRPAAAPSHHSGKPTGLPTPRGSGKPTGLPTPHGSGKPTGLPTPHGSGKPTGLPTPHGSGKPTGLPTPHGSGKPSALPAATGDSCNAPSLASVPAQVSRSGSCGAP